MTQSAHSTHTIHCSYGTTELASRYACTKFDGDERIAKRIDGVLHVYILDECVCGNCTNVLAKPAVTETPC